MMFQYLDLGRVPLYDVFNVLAGVVLAAFLLLRYQKYIDAVGLREKKRPVLLALGQLALIGIVFFALFSLLNPRFARWFTRRNANYFGNLTAWLITLLVIPFLFRVSPLRAMDVLSPALPLSLFVAKIACFCCGCCYGFTMRGSFYYNELRARHEFPVQMLESLVALGLFFLLLRYEKKNRTPGSVFPLYLAAYGAARFITEFFRADLPNVLGPLDAYQILSVAFALIGAGLLFLLRKHGDRIEKTLCRKRPQRFPLEP